MLGTHRRIMATKRNEATVGLCWNHTIAERWFHSHALGPKVNIINGDGVGGDGAGVLCALVWSCMLPRGSM